MKSVFFAGLLFVTVTATAQDIPSRPNEGIQRTETRRERYDVYQKLKLTADQKSRLIALQKEGKAAVSAVRKDDALAPAEKKEKLRALQQQQAQKRNALLTPEQQKIWEQEASGQKGDKQQWVTVDRRNTTKSPGRDDNQLSQTSDKHNPQLKLSADQQQKMKDLQQTFKTQARGIRQDNRLSAEEKKSRINGLKKEFRKKQKNVLTDEQWQQWKDKDRKNISKK
ncbi:hypothetical protein LQ567_17525 [Niabella pedocola]|uniref:DUF4890 domain-containing protein n=1 Tax=Niabella pedocola TaxID=1752077 RepID=A0ABS8PUK1_9BACT|nr:hypothetical protein [Niabella pedocola]MCD2424585.1 hypothetical protein [Niabella pedocola]